MERLWVRIPQRAFAAVFKNGGFFGVLLFFWHCFALFGGFFGVLLIFSAGRSLGYAVLRFFWASEIVLRF